MPSQKPTITFRADSAEQQARWKQAAEDAGMSFNEFACAALDAAVELLARPATDQAQNPASAGSAAARSSTGAGRASRSKAKTKVVASSRKGECEHGTPETAYCKQGCDGP